MKAKIDKNGNLYLEKRAGHWQRQDCPFSLSENFFQECGCWCPLFEIYKYKDTGRIKLILCQKTYEISELTDERERHAKRD